MEVSAGEEEAHARSAEAIRLRDTAHPPAVSVPAPTAGRITGIAVTTGIAAITAAIATTGAAILAGDFIVIGRTTAIRLRGRLVSDWAITPGMDIRITRATITPRRITMLRPITITTAHGTTLTIHLRIPFRRPSPFRSRTRRSMSTMGSGTDLVKRRAESAERNRNRRGAATWDYRLSHPSEWLWQRALPSL